MLRSLTLILAILIALILCPPLLAAPEIIDLPDALDAQFDLTWEMHGAPKAGQALRFVISSGSEQAQYLLTLDASRACWKVKRGESITSMAESPLSFPAQVPQSFTLKRRPDTVALLCNHRLLFAAPAPTLPRERLVLDPVPVGVTLGEIRYEKIGRLLFGDDFMRPEAERKLASGSSQWVEDPTWPVAFYKFDSPGFHASEPQFAEIRNPWRLSFYDSVARTANGFWLLYTGAGPSWTVANPIMVYPSADRYFVQAAVKTEYDSEVGLLAAYQDNRNYLLFRWRQRAQSPGAELIAVTDGERKVLASSSRGFDPGQWYTLRLNLGWRRVQALVDGQLLLQADTTGCCEGRIGLYANGAAVPRRPKLDDETATMYLVKDEKTGQLHNDAADELRSTSCIYFDDVRMGDWIDTGDLLTTSYPKKVTGQWSRRDGGDIAEKPGQLLAGSAQWSSYAFQTRLKLPANGQAGLYFHIAPQGSGYLWLLTTKGQQLCPVNRGQRLAPIAESPAGIPPGSFASLRVEADGPYIALYNGEQRVMDAYDPTRTAGRCGLLALTPGVTFAAPVVTVAERHVNRVKIHKGFESNKWLSTWATAESDWYPAMPPTSLTTPAGDPHLLVGNAAPVLTASPGLYWHKGGHYHDLRVSIPLPPRALTGQVLHLATAYERQSAYQFQLTTDQEHGLLRLLRGNTPQGEYRFPLQEHSRLLIERRGSYLLATYQTLDAQTPLDAPEVLHAQTLLVYRDPHPLPAEMVGFTVTSPELPAASILVDSDRRQEAFEYAPTDWTVESGVWAVMARYSCDPSWDWFGGFGSGTPTIWNKTRLDGDQTVEIYAGIKMQLDNAADEYVRRYRDINLTICADGEHLNSGYTVIRAGQPVGRAVIPVTMLLRQGVVVKTSTLPAHLLPPQHLGHRQWFATRIEKRGGEIQVFLDNLLAFTYSDPDPLPGGYVGIWTLNNGLMVGRVNYAAQRMTLGAPRAAAPLIVQQELPPQPVPSVQLDGRPLAIATFETGFDGCNSRKGLTGCLTRERATSPTPGTNTVLKVVNSYPAGDLSCTLYSTPVDLAINPVLHFDYRFAAGARINLYLRRGNRWYGILLTGMPSSDPDILAAGQTPALADGRWHQVTVNLKSALERAIRQHFDVSPKDYLVQEIVLADWGAPADVRHYGLGDNPGGSSIYLDNIALIPLLANDAKLSWAPPPGTTVTRWRTGLDRDPQGLPQQEVVANSTTLPLEPGTRYFHLQAGTADGAWGPILTIPLIAETPSVTETR
ncbi:MAG TPA: hypothetical protein VGM23_12370 [Armatimonadota bacterium]